MCCFIYLLNKNSLHSLMINSEVDIKYALDLAKV